MPTGVMLGGLRAGETLTSAEHKKRNMANNFSENSKLRSRGGEFSLGEEEGRCNFQSSFVGIQAEPMEVVAKPGGCENFQSMSNLRMSARTWSSERRVRI